MKSLTSLELESFLKIARKHSERDGLMFQVIFNHGLRISETLSLTASNIVDGHLVVQRLKGSRKTVQPLLPNEKDGLLALAKGPGLFFPMHRQTARLHMREYCQEAGIPAWKSSPHKLKHSTGVLAHKGGKGMSIPELQAYLGHRSGASTMIYLECDEDTACSAFAAAVGG